MTGEPWARVFRIAGQAQAMDGRGALATTPLCGRRPAVPPDSEVVECIEVDARADVPVRPKPAGLMTDFGANSLHLITNKHFQLPTTPYKTDRIMQTTLFLAGIALWAYVYYLFSQQATKMIGFKALTTYEDAIAYFISPLFIATHEVGHCLMALLTGSTLKGLNIGFSARSSDDGRVWSASLGLNKDHPDRTAHYEVRSNLTNGLCAAGPLLLWVPLAGYLTMHPVFNSVFLNGLLVGHLLVAGFEVFWSRSDRAQAAEALWPLAYAIGGVLSFALSAWFLVRGLHG